ncbi:DUF3231 family protein [Halalkalibacter okhensis]|uniref:DUF3231 family protein n=1 Tax=Halalkalibacter okhensis TaxID=333138 RepID=A0A0B0IF82_9BACI|nr:DUF3231 family protein [Halalkalibacter okhensis]KHF39945.1 hypothetical protein LQ50_11655 [Halalkalibacter okhensis]
MTNDHINLTSSEIASLWTMYMNETMLICILGFMMNNIEDQEIHPIVEHALNISLNHEDKLTTLFRQEGFAVPNGFTKEDVNLNAASLYTDTFCLTYINHMSKAAMLEYSGFLALSVRKDIRDLFTNALSEIITLFNLTSTTAVEKGLSVRAPYIPLPKKQDYIDKKNYLSGLNPFTKHRPVNAIEISHLFMNIQTNLIGLKLCLSFAQTSPTKEVQKFMLKGKEISEKHIKIFSDTLISDDIQSPIGSDVCISNSTTPVFSDKLTMFHMSLLSATGIGNYATAAAASQRNDLVLNYERLSFEIGQFAKTGADIMIKNNWLEQPPGTVDRENLAFHKNNHLS